jgi:uncharacterized protein YcfJ
MRKSSLITTQVFGMLLAGASLLPSTTWAQGYASTDSSFRDFARVTRVEPLYRTVQVSTPVQNCWDEPVTVRQQHVSRGHGHGGHWGQRERRGRSYTGPIVGGIVGGLVGNQFGKGDGRTLLTVSGAVLGASVGNDVGNRRHQRHHRALAHSTTYTTTERRCSTNHNVSNRQERDGFLVEYKYRGRNYSTRLDYDPGDRLPVDVQVVPAR